MAKNYVQDGEVISITATASVLAGGVAVIGKRIAIPLRDLAVGATGSAQVTGVWALPKLGTDVVAPGDLLYWDAANSRVTTTANGNTLAGFATVAAANGTLTVEIKINA